ncbi:hypothetical protein AAVH_16614 [Aphelenchoides avenae]|nr:hypothetical protein AAVH_16614 [Aphelenchus avenae]
MADLSTLVNECCRQHDICYTQCVSQRRCDADFDDCIAEAEKWALPWYKGCIGLDAHAFIVKQVGHGAIPQECQKLVEIHLMNESEEWKKKQRMALLDFIASKYDLASRMKRHKLFMEEGSGEDD